LESELISRKKQSARLLPKKYVRYRKSTHVFSKCRRKKRELAGGKKCSIGNDISLEVQILLFHINIKEQASNYVRFK
jgi:hypothetical protein